jgi:hypothetical protein
VRNAFCVGTLLVLLSLSACSAGGQRGNSPAFKAGYIDGFSVGESARGTLLISREAKQRVAELDLYRNLRMLGAESEQVRQEYTSGFWAGYAAGEGG